MPEQTGSGSAIRDNSPKAVDFEIDNWGFVHGRVEPKRRLIGLAVVFGGGLVLLLIIIAMYRLGGDNFGTVKEGQVYRSSMPSGAEVKVKIKKYGIKTVLRLVGTKDQNTEGFVEESEAIAETDATLLVAPMPTSRLPYRSELQTLFKHLDNVELPMLIHCKQGSDRTGLASVIWLHDYENVPLYEARKQLDFWPYMHVSAGRGGSVDDFLDRFVQEAGGGVSIQYWVKTMYFDAKERDEVTPWNDGRMYRP
ncbi:MAG: tyrosine-protein phosphatase [Planctomycetota bacterium]|jgi:protein tyrosine phosphatase (PTP) superfamily phosphohydrolase (DUF442 family)